MVNINSTKKMYKYLFENDEYPYSGRDYQFLIITFKKNENHNPFLDTLMDMFNGKEIICINHNYIMFYFDNDIRIKDVFLSLCIDFGVVVRVFDGGKINNKNREDFHVIYQYYQQFIENGPFIFSNTIDLVLEVIKTDINSIKKIRQAILKDISEDSQMEQLILAMFENDLNVAKTAKAVYMHRNTVNNKLEQIKLKTGLNIQYFKDALCMYWLIKIK